MRIGQKLSISIAIILIGNAVNGLIRGELLFYYIMYVGIFIPIILILLLFPKTPKNRIVSIILLILSCIGVWFGGDSNLVSATLFCFAIYIIRPEKRTIYVYSGSLIISMILKFTFMGLNIPQFFVVMAGSSFIIILYQHYIHPRQKIDSAPPVICPELDSETLKIVQKLYLGCSVKDISDMVYLTQDAVSKRIGRARNTMGAKTTAHLLAICRENGYIRYNLDNQAKTL